MTADIKHSIFALLPTRTKWSEKLARWMRASAFSAEIQQIEDGMTTFLNAVMDWDDLMTMYGVTFPESAPRRLVEDRMKMVIKVVTHDDLGWFDSSLRNPTLYPSSLRFDI